MEFLKEFISFLAARKKYWLLPVIIAIFLFGGLISSFLVGVLSLKILLKLLKDGKFHFFGVYCVLIGLITLIL